jgi:predicted DNA-binding transcriptional regulator AlpA
MSDDAKSLLDADETAALLGISRGHLLRLARKGQISGRVKLGKVVKFSAARIKREIEHGEDAKVHA